MQDLVNEYGVVDLDFASSIDDDMMRLMKLIQPTLANVSMVELRAAMSYIQASLTMSLAEYQMGRQMAAIKARDQGRWIPGNATPNTYRPAMFTIDDVNWFEGYMMDMRTWASIERGDPIYTPSWNGHKMPMFSLEQGIKLANSLNEQVKGVVRFPPLAYVGEHDEYGTLFVAYDNHSDELDEYPEQQIDLATGEQITAYPIGAGFWIWDGYFTGEDHGN